MRNYGEVLVCWYFRLNGFIPMVDFVLHGDDVHHSTDCDLIAVRFPHVYESIGGRDADWDHELLRLLGYDGDSTLAAFVQVKTGEEGGRRVGEIRDHFGQHVGALVGRLGFWPVAQGEAVSREFRARAI